MVRVNFTFDAPEVSEGRISTLTQDGVTVRFLRSTSVFRPTVPTSSGRQAIRNSSQDPHDETGHQKPMLLEFTPLQQRVSVKVGLNENDPSQPAGVRANLLAYDEDGNVVTTSSVALGRGPSPITAPLVVNALGDVIHRVLIAYDGLAEEVVDDLEAESAGARAASPDNVPPVVVLTTPRNAEVVNDRTVRFAGRVIELNGVSLVVNGTPVPVRRVDNRTWEFSGEAMATEEGVLLAVARDEAGNEGNDAVRVYFRPPQRFVVGDVGFTQTGLVGPPMPPVPVRVARKTSLFYLDLAVQGPSGVPTFVDGAYLHFEGGPVCPPFPGQQRPRFGATEFGWSPPRQLRSGALFEIDSTTRVYFFVTGRWLSANTPYRIILRLAVRGRTVYEEVLLENWVFTAVPGITMLIAPQHRPFDDDHTTALLQAGNEMARMFPVADGVANLDSETPGGVRMAVLPPTDYAGHVETIFEPRPSFEEAFVVRDHMVIEEPGPDGRWNTGNDDVARFWAGEFLPINWTGAEDGNRDGVFDEEELGRFRGTDHAAWRRMVNWENFAEAQAHRARLRWNEARPSAPDRHARRAIVTPTRGGSAPQNRTGLAGNAGREHVVYWADVEVGPDADIPGGAFLQHETGHTYFGPDHADDTGPCALTGEWINLLTREIVTSPTAVMCSMVGGSPSHFLQPGEYDRLFARLSRTRSN